MEYKIKLTGRNYLVPVMADGHLILLNSKNSKQLIPAFTNEEEFAKLNIEGVRPEVFSYDRLKGLVVDDPDHLNGIVVNPFGEKIILNQEAIEKIDRATRGMSVKRASHRGTVKLWQPSSYPEGMLETMEHCFEEQGGVRKAWLFFMQGEEEPAPHWMMMLEFDGDRKVVFPIVAKAMKPYMKAGESFELMRAEGALGDHARSKGTPFYQSTENKPLILH